ncbi:helix-turn-helix domain-containing protein [Jatrophihabitans sp. DSM 44399]|uniref:Helix-turn-helix domain-containing protein n=1 Tax=Jatrophihabitans lederbergiae TaxID=3075547 RepID=A0ABU2JF70_9ACTN|nr:helix-turn-helix domain-containing protein [Jatrophihabitans sp. DSM 44399]MDT0263643.1 helix-turn-helix domain-containing protein [Jatrophihabitans sp. DSM 44399]
MPKVDAAATSSARKRADARHTEQPLLDAAPPVFITHGVDAPVREIAAKADVGMGTIYRYFPTRADLVIAVYRHQVEALASAAPHFIRLVPACVSLLNATVQGGEIGGDIDALTLMHAAGNLCIGVEAPRDTGYNAHAWSACSSWACGTRLGPLPLMHQRRQ